MDNMGNSSSRNRRLPSTETTIAKILESPSDFSRVRLTGIVISNDEGRRVLEINDGTGLISVFSNESALEKSVVRVIGRVAPLSDGGVDIDAEILQVLEGVDIKVISRIKELKSKLQAQYDRDHPT